MKPLKRRLKKDVLHYSPTPVARATVRRKYVSWRQEQGMPVRCDIAECTFHTEPLVWAGKALPLILDHANGNNLDNNPSNLRYVCPNCEAQLSTRGGANRGRVDKAGECSYVLKSRDGRRHYYFFPETGHIRISGSAPTVLIKSLKERE